MSRAWSPAALATRYGAGAVIVLMVACGGSVPAAPPPLRPTPRPAPPKDTNPARTDCDRVRTTRELPAMKYDERSIEEGHNLSTQGFDLLKAAETRSIAQEERERLIAQAVRRFITALAADPYNVHATYNLAAAYGRIGRRQCAVNLLTRLVALRRLPSHRANVEEKLDRLFGRGKYGGQLDPDFFELRDDPRFRQVAKDLQ